MEVLCTIYLSSSIDLGNFVNVVNIFSLSVVVFNVHMFLLVVCNRGSSACNLLILVITLKTTCLCLFFLPHLLNIWQFSFSYVCLFLWLLWAKKRTQSTWQLFFFSKQRNIKQYMSPMKELPTKFTLCSFGPVSYNHWNYRFDQETLQFRIPHDLTRRKKL